jgi:hypothetical protein
MARISASRIQALLAAIDGAPNTDVKGDKLEELAQYMFAKLRGVDFLQRNILDGARAHELDVAFWNNIPVSSIPFVEALLVVECKAKAAPASSADVGWFIRKLQDRGLRIGILVALAGITGASDGQSNAHSEVLNAMVRDGIRVLVLSRSELEAMTSTEELADVLKRKYLRLTLDRVVE